MKEEKIDNRKDWRTYKKMLIGLLQIGDKIRVIEYHIYYKSDNFFTVVGISEDEIILSNAISYVHSITIRVLKKDIRYTKQEIYVFSGDCCV